MTENELLSAVIDLAHVYSWRVLHIRPARTEKGWRSPVQGDGKGFVDLLMVRKDRLLGIELKSDKGRITPEQMGWLGDLELAGVETSIWRPKDWNDGSITMALRP